jgi:hypothetical protein
MFYFQKKFIIFNPLEQFEISSISYCFSTFFRLKVEQQSCYNLKLFFNQDIDIDYGYLFHHEAITLKMT